MAETLARRFAERQVYLVANSWGTFVAVPAVQARPDLFAAYVGTGQMVSATETDRMFYEDTLAWARSTGDSALVRQLRAQGPPPYDSLWDYEVALSHERDWNDYRRMPAYESQGEMPANLFVGEYSLLGKLRALGAFLDTFSVLYPQLRDVDLRRSATSLDVPVFMVEGRHEVRGRLGLAGEWYDALQAPVKQRFDFPRAGTGRTSSARPCSPRSWRRCWPPPGECYRESRPES